MNASLGLRSWRLMPTAALLLLALAAAACGDDRIVTPVFGARCSAGDLQVGTNVNGAFDEASPCIDARHFWTGYRAPYDAYSMRLVAGKAYLFRMERRPDPLREGRNGVDPVLALFGRDDAGMVMPLALSDDEGGDRASEIFLVAPRTGEYQLVASVYGSALDEDDLGGYLLTTAECPVLGHIAGTGTTTFTMRPSACTRHDAASLGEPAAYRFVTIDAGANERVTVTIAADSMTPVWELYGPTLDVYANLYDGSRHEEAYGPGNRSIDVRAPGRLTLAIGMLGTPGREFEVSVTRAPLPAMLQAAPARRKAAPPKR